MIAEILPEGHPTIEKVARSMGSSVRTLQRRLANKELSYSEILDEVRRNEACRLLERRNQSISIVSSSLGYSEPSAFTRAFSRWMGLAPSKYRQRLAGEPNREG